MAFYQLPLPNQVVRWLPSQPRTVLRFVAGGGLVLLHATDEPLLTAKAWLTQPLQLGLLGIGRGERPGPEVPPVLCARLGEWPAIAAPACIFELGEAGTIYQWHNAQARPAALRLVLLRCYDQQPGQAAVVASRRIWSPEWSRGDELLRLRLEQQYQRTSEEDEGLVQHTGRKLVATIPAAHLLDHAPFRFREPGGGQLDALTLTDERRLVLTN